VVGALTVSRSGEHLPEYIQRRIVRCRGSVVGVESPVDESAKRFGRQREVGGGGVVADVLTSTRLVRSTTSYPATRSTTVHFPGRTGRTDGDGDRQGDGNSSPLPLSLLSPGPPIRLPANAASAHDHWTK
jgi:hypothetical protein